MEGLYYTKENYWIMMEGDIATVGLTNFILDNVDMINYVELPSIGTICNKTDLLGNINYNEDEDFELYSQFSGEIVDINDSLVDDGEQLLSNNKNDNWLYRIAINSHNIQDDDLMDEEEYGEYIKGL